MECYIAVLTSFIYCTCLITFYKYSEQVYVIEKKEPGVTAAAEEKPKSRTLLSGTMHSLNTFEDDEDDEDGSTTNLGAKMTMLGAERSSYDPKANQGLLHEDTTAMMPDDYDDTDLTEEEQMFQRTVMLNLISSGFRQIKANRRTTVGLSHDIDITGLDESNF